MPNKTLGMLLREGEAALHQQGVPDAAFDARCLLAHCMQIPLPQLRLYAQDAAETAVQSRFDAMLSRRASGEPLQYILGVWEFYDCTFAVRDGVLIPRPETEYLAEQAIRLLPPGGVLYDVCAGTGCIGITAAVHRPDAQVYLFEKYPIPLETIQENIRRNGTKNAHVAACDMFDGVPDGIPLPDCIVSNPPYICTDELPTLQKEVRREPRQALDGGRDGLMFYRALSALWFPKLREGGVLLAECGEGQPRAVAALFPNAAAETDFTGTERFVTVRKTI